MSTIFDIHCEDCDATARDQLRRAPSGTNLFLAQGRAELAELGQFLIDHEYHDLRLEHE